MAQPFLANALDRGIPVDQLLEPAGLSYSDIQRGEIFMVGQHWYDLIDAVAEAVKNPFLGFEVGTYTAIDALPNVKVLKTDGATFGELLTALVIDVARISTMANYLLQTDGKTAELIASRTFTPKSPPSQADGYYAGFLVRLCRECCGEDWKPGELKVTLCDPDVIPEKEVEQLSVRRGNRLGAQFEFPADWLLLRYRGIHAQSLPEKPANGTEFLGRLDRLIDLHLEKANLSLAKFSELTAQSPSKLKRTLENHGTTLQRQLDILRRKRALALLENSEAPLSSIGKAVGFPEPPSFSRAFKRWTGLSPLQYRQMSRKEIEDTGHAN
jgi:AraC-like DNA-binding protein